jgi:hypothetical protein
MDKKQERHTQEKTTAGWSTFENLQTYDHDTLIRLETIVTQISSDIKELKDGISDKLADHEIRIKTCEKILDEHATEDLPGKTLANYAWIHDFNTRWQLIVTLAGFIGGMIALAVPYVWKLLKL